MSASANGIVHDITESDRTSAEAAQFWNVHEPEAKAELRELLLSADVAIRGPSIDASLEILGDDFLAAVGEEFQALRKSAANGMHRDDAELGRIVRKAIENAADAYVESEVGRRWVANRVYALKREHDGGYSE